MREEQAAAHAHHSSGAWLPGLAIARFCATYPGLFHGGWPTRDGYIPYRLFALLYRAIPHVQATSTLSRAHGTAAGIGLSFGDKGAKAIRPLTELAYPEEHG